MPHALVVDNSVSDCQELSAILTANDQYTVDFADSPQAALEALAHRPADVILVDISMPTLSGSNLIPELKNQFRVPIVIVSSKGRESQAICALKSGASSYVPKDLLTEELLSTLRDVLEYSQQEKFQLRMLERMDELQCKFVLENDRALVPPLVSYLQEHFGRIGVCEDSDLMRVGIALDEALVNAIYHGNLELSSKLREDGDSYYQLAEERAQVSPYKERRLYVEALISRDLAEVLIRDDGPGFDASTLPDPRDPANLEKVSGRGVLLMRTFMDEVIYNEKGNSVLLRKYREKPSSSDDTSQCD